jgi:hypothetical protein
MPFKTKDVSNWHITGKRFDVYNCDVGCPGEFGSDPTPAFCEGIVGWIIRKSYCGESRLFGLAAVTVVRVGGSILERNREIWFIRDDRANPYQCQALKMIYSGNAGGHLAMWTDLTIRPLGMVFAPIKNFSHARRLVPRGAGQGAGTRAPIPQTHGAGRGNLHNH